MLVTENYSLQDPQTAAENVKEEGDDDDDGSHPVKTLLTPADALTSMSLLDRCLRSHDDSGEMLYFLSKIDHYGVRNSVSNPKQLMINNFFAKK